MIRFMIDYVVCIFLCGNMFSFRIATRLIPLFSRKSHLIDKDVTQSRVRKKGCKYEMDKEKGGSK
jgi:hypothetical protein